MQLHDLQPKHKRKDEKRVGRGGKRGTYSGRGIKGQKSRAGHKLQPVIRPLFKRYPKKRGYRFKSIQIKPEIVNIGTLAKAFNAGEKITPETLVAKGLIRKKAGKFPKVKILGNGKIEKEFVIQGCALSETAQKKIEGAGGKIVI